MIMGTAGIIRALRTYWKLANHPLYIRRQHQIPAPTPTPTGKPSIFSRILTIIMLLVGGFFCATVGFLGLLTIFGLMLYLWPILVMRPTSGIIAGERESQTWDILLTTPFDWQ